MTTNMKDRQTVVLFGKPGLRPHSFGRVRGGTGCRGPVKEIQQRLSKRVLVVAVSEFRRASAVEGVIACCIRKAMTGPVIAKQRREGRHMGYLQEVPADRISHVTMQGLAAFSTLDPCNGVVLSVDCAGTCVSGSRSPYTIVCLIL